MIVTMATAIATSITATMFLQLYFSVFFAPKSQYWSEYRLRPSPCPGLRRSWRVSVSLNVSASVSVRACQAILSDR